MTPQEKDVIGGIFDRLKQAENAPRDAEAERFIADRIKAQPYAPYVMTQAIYAQEQALQAQQQQIEALQAELEAERQRAQAQPAGGFLSGLFGGGRPAAPAPAAAPQDRAPFQHRPMGAPMGAPPAMGMQPGQQPGAPAGPWGQQRQGGGFLATAGAAALGVAGGILAANALSSMFGGSGGQAQAAPAPVEPAAPTAQPASYDDGGFDGGYDGGGDDWA